MYFFQTSNQSHWSEFADARGVFLMLAKHPNFTFAITTTTVHKNSPTVTEIYATVLTLCKCQGKSVSFSFIRKNQCSEPLWKADLSWRFFSRDKNVLPENNTAKFSWSERCLLLIPVYMCIAYTHASHLNEVSFSQRLWTLIFANKRKTDRFSLALTEC